MTMKMTVKELRAKLYEIRDQEQEIAVGAALEALLTSPHGTKLSEGAHDLLIAYAKDAQNWDGTPLVGGNVDSSKQNSGYLLALKKQGYIKTYTDGDRADLQWLVFTDKGIRYAEAMGVIMVEAKRA